MSTTTTGIDRLQRPGTTLLDQLADRVAGRVLRPGSEEYAAVATPWNVALAGPQAAQHLAAVEVRDAADVAAVVRFAGEHGLEVTVQATGHGAYSTAPRAGGEGLLILTHLLDELRIDPITASARIGAGVRWQRVLDAAAPHGLSGLAGSATHVGVIGYLTGGGLGPVARTFGFASDQVTAIEVVTGDAEQRRATATEHPDLFWALRGGKGALGVVTAVETGLLPISELYGGSLFFAGADGHTVLHAWAEWSAHLPDAASTSLAVLRLPPLPGVPPPLAGQVALAVRFAWVGDPDEGARVVAPMRELAPVILGGLGVMPYAALGSIHADPVDPMPTIEHATLLRDLPTDAVEALLGYVGADAECPQVIVELRLLGGALARNPEQPSALCHRDAAYTLLAIGIGVPPVLEPTTAHAEALLTAMGPWDTGNDLPNFMPRLDPTETARKYDEATRSRLGSLVTAYDPQGVIRAAEPFRPEAS